MSAEILNLAFVRLNHRITWAYFNWIFPDLNQRSRFLKQLPDTNETAIAYSLYQEDITLLNATLKQRGYDQVSAQEAIEQVTMLFDKILLLLSSTCQSQL